MNNKKGINMMTKKELKLFKKILSEEKLSDTPKDGKDQHIIMGYKAYYFIIREDRILYGHKCRTMTLVAYDKKGNFIDCLCVAGLFFDDDGNVMDIIYDYETEYNIGKEVK